MHKFSPNLWYNKTANPTRKDGPPMTTRAIIATYVRTHAWRNLSLTRTTASLLTQHKGAHRPWFSTGSVRPCAAFFYD